MAEMIFSYWGGELTDNRHKTGKKAPKPARLKLPSEFKPGVPIKAFVGWDGFAIRDKSISVVDMCRAYMEAVQEVSCGKCFPCRVGTKVIAEI
ncbi:MAG: NADH-ubiquinone oxidoreductase-F iron-sulfur binding region domain-containing protein, partial [Deltaproteobacteria bacterium]